MSHFAQRQNKIINTVEPRYTEFINLNFHSYRGWTWPNHKPLGKAGKDVGFIEYGTYWSFDYTNHSASPLCVHNGRSFIACLGNRSASEMWYLPTVSGYMAHNPPTGLHSAHGVQALLCRSPCPAHSGGCHSINIFPLRKVDNSDKEGTLMKPARPEYNILCTHSAQPPLKPDGVDLHTNFQTCQSLLS